MLGVSSYPQDYIDSSRARVDAQLAAYRALAADGDANGALAAFAPPFFNNMVLVLDGLFVHRLRKLEGKDGNPLNEVRALAASVMAHDGVLTVEGTTRLKPETSVLGLAPGDPIALSEDSFARLSAAYFDEIEKRFGPSA